VATEHQEYDIQEMFIEGLSPNTISTVLEMDIESVLKVLESFGVAETPQTEEYLLP
jgi:hypothetical protein